MSGDPVGAVIAAEAPDLLAAKAEAAWPRMIALAVLAGAFIAFGSIAFLIVQAMPDEVDGPVQLLSGAAFSVGLLLVMVAGGELFTGNTMFVLPVFAGRLKAGRMAAACAAVWVGNLAGSLLVAILFVAAGGLDPAVGRAAAEVAATKLAKDVPALLASGVLANMLVCLAVWMAMAARTIPAKAVAIVGPVTVFVAAGLEHSIANMSLLPIGLMAGAEGDLAAVARNLAVSTVGNILGGGAVALMLAAGHGKGD